MNCEHRRIAADFAAAAAEEFRGTGDRIGIELLTYALLEALRGKHTPVIYKLRSALADFQHEYRKQS